VLHALDRRRARAFARGDPHALQTVYEPRSAVLAADRAALAAYRERALTVEGAGFRLLAVRAVRVDGRHVVVRTVDRLRPTTIRRAGSPAGLPLPRDQPTVHRIALDRGPGGGWRIAAVSARTG
jgi:hypothetical protein